MTKNPLLYPEKYPKKNPSFTLFMVYPPGASLPFCPIPPDPPTQVTNPLNLPEPYSLFI